MQTLEEMASREILVRGQIVVYSVDNRRWFSDKDEAIRCQQRRDQFFAERSKSIKKSAIFVHKTRRIGQARRRDQTRTKPPASHR